MKHKIAIITTGLTGMLYASLKYYNRLESLGFEMFFASPFLPEHFTLPSKIKYRKLRPVNFDNTKNVKSKFDVLKHIITRPITKKKTNQENTFATIQNDFLQWVEKIDPDLLFIDIELHEYIISISSSNRSMILLSQWFSLEHDIRLPRLTSGYDPSKNNMQTILLDNLKDRLKRAKNQSISAYFTRHSDRRSRLLSLHGNLKLNKNILLHYRWPGPFSYRSIPIWSMNSKALDFNGFAPKYFKFIGPQVYLDRSELNTKEVEEFIKSKAKSEKLIYLSISTMKKTKASFMIPLIKEIAKNKNYKLIVSYGNLNIENLNNKSILLKDKVDQISILSQADISINHGGIHTINECIYFGVPMLIMSGNQHDQSGCAARVAHHGLGHAFFNHNTSPRAIMESINILLQNSIYRENIKQIQKHNLNAYTDLMLYSQIMRCLENNAS